MVPKEDATAEEESENIAVKDDDKEEEGVIYDSMGNKMKS